MPTVMITGTNRGLGFEFVKQYAADGWRVFAAYRHPTSADSLRLLAGRSKGLVEVVNMDVTDPRSVKQAAAQIGNGAVDVLINSAGIAGKPHQKARNVDYESWAAVFNVNTMGPLRVIEAFIDHLSRSERKLAVRGALANGNRQRDHGLSIFIVGHHGGQIRAADERKQTLFILTQTRQPDFQVVQNVDIGDDGMMRNALESLVAEMAGLATADHRRRDFEVSKATQAGQRGDDRWHVTDLIFGQVTGFRARVGDKQTEWRLQLIAMAQTGGFKSVRDILWPLFVHPARHDDVALKRAVFKMMDDTGSETFIRQEKAIMSRPDSRPSLGAIHCPTLVLVGNEDALTPVSAARMIAEGIVGSKLDIVQDCGHLSTMERPDAVTEALRARIAL